ncbi:hypothetical protein SAMN02745136_02045 [Anaerocolumna jejuensis DSM 15929]|uniref:Uncharacterized protein n=1 Tax=Anaerocolumna jejuensis DSM 15929 TaxID=1121322 RepID=A0A1M6QUP8_9FIRM|nr:hypothetical protein [Anaerocolumna jejuensis]SHK24029.1 hypothetical protein SAMN02745136_02045 [Anaerocolumna jejuensis DSM 15929]
MKKKLCVLLVFLFIVCLFAGGFIVKRNYTSTVKYGFQPLVDKLYWGMPLTKIEKALSIKNNADGVVYSYNNPVTTINLNKKIKVFGYYAAVSLEVYDKPREEWYPYKSTYLAGVKLTYDDMDGKKIKDNIIKEYKSDGNDWIDLLKNNCTTWLSSDKVKDIKPGMKKELQNYWNMLDEHSSSAENNSLFSIKKDENESINKLLLVYSDKGAVVSFSGETALQINQIATH